MDANTQNIHLGGYRFRVGLLFQRYFRNEVLVAFELKVKHNGLGTVQFGRIIYIYCLNRHYGREEN